MIPVILAGGSGTRFWPLSRREHPKQLVSLGGDDRPLIEVTAERLTPLSGAQRPVHVVCSGDLIGPTTEALGNTSRVEFIEEPIARNTAPAIALACAHLEQRYGDEPVGIFPADHFVGSQQGFETTVGHAAERAEDGAILTIGIPPNRPETGYGYIETDRPVADAHDGPVARPVEQFVEKPPHDRAVEYLRSGRFLWNSGIFVMRPSTLWEEFRRQRPAMFECIERIRQALEEPAGEQRDQTIAAAFADLESIPIDYAIMEGARRVQVVPALFRWSDVGHWGALHEVMDTDADGNVVDADAVLEEVTDSVVVSRDSSRLIAASGLDGMVVVDTKDAVLVVPRDRAQQVRDIVAKLQAEDRDDLL